MCANFIKKEYSKIICASGFIPLSVCLSVSICLLHLSLSVCLWLFLFVCLYYFYLSVFVYFYFVCLLIHLCLYTSICRSVCLSVCLGVSVCLSVWVPIYFRMVSAWPEPSETHQSLVLLRIEGYSIREIANKLKISYTSVHNLSVRYFLHRTSQIAGQKEECEAPVHKLEKRTSRSSSASSLII